MEIWKNIPGYNGIYQASTYGNIRSTNYRNTGETKLLKPGLSGGRLYVALHCISKSVHKLIAITFLIPVKGSNQVNHINGISTDNRSSNLEWCNQSFNMRESYRLGLHTHKGLKAKSIICYNLDGSILKRYESITMASKELGISIGTISKNCNGQSKSVHKKFTFRFT